MRTTIKTTGVKLTSSHEFVPIDFQHIFILSNLFELSSPRPEHTGLGGSFSARRDQLCCSPRRIVFGLDPGTQIDTNHELAIDSAPLPKPHFSISSCSLGYALVFARFSIRAEQTAAAIGCRANSLRHIWLLPVHGWRKNWIKCFETPDSTSDAGSAGCNSNRVILRRAPRR